MPFIRLILITFFVLYFTNNIDAEGTNWSDTTTITLVVIGAIVIVAAAYSWISSSVHKHSLKNDSADQVIGQMTACFNDAQHAWDFHNYADALFGFTKFCKDYEQIDIDRIKIKLKKHYEIAQNANIIIPKQKDTTAYNKAKQNDDIDSYKSYLTDYPSGIFTNDVISRLHNKEAAISMQETEAFQGLQNNKTLFTLRDFCTQYPNSRYVGNVMSEISRLEIIEKDSLDFYESVSQNTISSYNAYLTSFPSGKYVSVAKDSLSIQTINMAQKEMQLYKSAMAKQTLEACSAYTNEFPSGEHIQQINKEIKTIEEKETQREEKEAQKQERLSHLEEISDNICSNTSAITMCQNLINQERRVAARSGYVDMNIIHKNTQAIIFLEDQNAKLLKDYRKITGKPFNDSYCKKKEEEEN